MKLQPQITALVAAPGQTKLRPAVVLRALRFGEEGWVVWSSTTEVWPQATLIAEVESTSRDGINMQLPPGASHFYLPIAHMRTIFVPNGTITPLGRCRTALMERLMPAFESFLADNPEYRLR